MVPQERTAATEAPHQETSVAAAVGRATPSTSSADTQGERETDRIFQLRVHLQEILTLSDLSSFRTSRRGVAGVGRGT